MIKLSEIEERNLEVTVKEGDVRKYDLIDIAKSLHEIMAFGSDGEVDPMSIFDNLDKIKDIFKIEGLTSSQAIILLQGVKVEFETAFADLLEESKELEDPTVKKKVVNASNSGDSTEETSKQSSD